MPSLDTARGRARLSLEHVGVIGALFAGEPVSAQLAEAHEELVRAGLIGGDGVPVPALGPLVRVLASAWLTIDVETVGAGGLVGHGLWVARTEAVTAEGWPGQEECEYAPLEPAMLPWAVARIVGLRRSNIPAEDEGVRELRTSLRTVDGAVAALAETPAAGIGAAREAVREVLDSDGRLLPEERRMLGDVLVSHRVSWRVTASWPGQDGTRAVRSLAVLDAGQAGYWRRDDPTPEQHAALGPEAPVVLVRRRAADLWRELIDLLPEPGTPATQTVAAVS